MAKILVIDDTPEYIEMLSSILSEYEVYAAKEGKKGILLAETVQPDLILLDINMPLMDGVETLKRIKLQPQLKEIPVIMLTTTDDQREVDKCYQLGCNVYITKPINFTLFAETLKRIGLFIQIMKV